MKLAICFNGHLRTYKQTYESFFKNVLEPQLKDGWEIDIFIHTWDEFEKAGFSWHNHFAAIDGVKVTEADIADVKAIYKPKKMVVATLTENRGAHISRAHSQQLALDYEQEMGFKYDWYMVVRPDLYFHNPLKINTYIDFYSTGEFERIYGKVPEKCVFAPHNIFGRMPVCDPRYIAEADLVWFGNFAPLPVPCSILHCYENGIYCVPIKYALHIDFFLQRVDCRVGWEFNYKQRHYEQLKELEHFAGFVKFYTRKQFIMKPKNFFAKLRRKTRSIRYPIKRFFGFGKK